jgi:SAM-dependent methyltransferase
MTGAKRWLLRLKRPVGSVYRRAQRMLEHALFERALQDTWVDDVSSGYLLVARGLWGCRIGRRDTFLDYGSGNGRVLLAAARFPFGRIIGVELNEPDNEIARANARIAAPRLRCPQIEVITADATVWPLPDDVTHIYMFNPFWGETFRLMLERVLDSLDRRPRLLTIVYRYPKCAPELLATGRFRRVRTSPGPRRGVPHQRIEVFQSIDDAHPRTPLTWRAYWPRNAATKRGL